MILVDPCVNPDGGARFAHWANMHKGKHLTAAPAHRDHGEAWPGGRTNHYWFDLNRDWLLLTHPESRGRIDMFQSWLPTVLTDYHEMGSGSTYFFQPGIPSRRNPLTPVRNHELTAAIATYHAEALDGIGSQYFTEERFDDFYYGKGSTYPDVQGSIGILFEQASSSGHLVDTRLGEMSFPFTIRNQFTTSLSTLRAADELRLELGSYQREFHRDAVEEAREGDRAGWLFGGPGQEASRVEAMADILARHRIEMRLARQDGEARDRSDALLRPRGSTPVPPRPRALRGSHLVGRQHLLRRLGVVPGPQLRRAGRGDHAVRAPGAPHSRPASAGRARERRGRRANRPSG